MPATSRSTTPTVRPARCPRSRSATRSLSPLTPTRIGVVFAVLLHDLISQAFDRYNRTGELLDPRLLVLLDEAANTPLPKLPQWASMVTGAGIQLITVWQSKAQLDQTYRQDADTVLTNHRSKLIYPSGISDLSTVQYVSDLVGDEHVRSDFDERGWHAGLREPRSARSPATALWASPRASSDERRSGKPSSSTGTCRLLGYALRRRPDVVDWETVRLPQSGVAATRRRCDRGGAAAMRGARLAAGRPGLALGRYLP